MEPAEFMLTDREQQVLELVARGLSNTQIDYALGIQPSTTRYHIRNLKSKLQVESRVSLVVEAIRKGLVRI